jgi:hypothetical protein
VSLLWAFLPDETETFTRVLTTWKAAVYKLTGVQLKPSVALSDDCDADIMSRTLWSTTFVNASRVHVSNACMVRRLSDSIIKFI